MPLEELPFYGQQPEQASDERVAPGGVVVALLAALAAILVLPAVSSGFAAPSADRAEAPGAPIREAAVDEPASVPPSVDGPAVPRAYVIGVPGPGEAVLPGVSGVSLLYTSVTGLPVLVDLDTGNRRQLVVEDDWRWYEFLIERGEIVRRPDTRHTWPVATDRALPVTAVRTRQDASGAWMIALCFASRCAPPPPGETIVIGIDSIRALDESVDPVIAELFDPDVWPRQGRWIQASAASGLDLRLPAPADEAAVWLVEQPG